MHKNTSSQKRHYPLYALYFLTVSFAIYHLSVGPYTEIPSDFWKHLARVVHEWNLFSCKTLVDCEVTRNLALSQSNYVYFLHAFVASLVKTHPIKLVTPVTLFTGFIFLGGIYFFSLRLFAKERMSIAVKVAIGLLAALLTVFSFGTATFSYLRYYGYFPTIFIFPLFLCSTFALLDYLECPKNTIRKLLPVLLFLVTMSIVHSQEALFTILTFSFLIIWRVIRSHRQLNSIPLILAHRAKSLLPIVIILFLILIAYALNFRTMEPWHNTPHILDIGKYVPLLSGLPIADPSFRFWDTVGLFGTFVFVWYIVRIREFRRNDFVTIGMFSPMFTHLNPFYSFIFLHYSSPTALWRTSYLMPIAFVAAFLIVTSLARAYRLRLPRITSTSVAVVALLSISLLPFEFYGYYNRTSRFPSIIPTTNNSGINLWDDLIDTTVQLNKQIDLRQILADEVTQFVLYAATFGEITQRSSHEYFPRHKSDYKSDFLSSDFTNCILVINKRNGSATGSALYSYHWPKDILTVASYYPADLEKFVETYDSHFELLWKDRDIAIYLMSSS